MTLLPIVGRELRVAARRPATYWARLSNATAALGFMGVMLVFSLGRSAKLLGFEIFQTIFFLTFISCVVAGAHLTADSISSEKREGTLGFLFLTDLKGFDVILGKLAVTSLRSLYNLMGVIPVIAVPILMGGIALKDVALAAVVLINTMLFSLAAGMLVSTLNTDARKAGGWAAMLTLVITAGLPITGGILAAKYGLNVFRDLFWLFAPSPAFAAFKVMDRQGFMAMDLFWTSTVTVFGWSVLFLLLASRLVTRTWQDRAVKQCSPAETREEKVQLRHRASRREELLGINPMLWLASRDPWRPYLAWGFLVAVGCIWLWLFQKVGTNMFSPVVCLWVVMAVHTVFKVGIASEAGIRFGTDVRTGALELILSTRTSVAELLRGQLLALRRQFGGPIIVTLAAEIVLLVAAMVSNAGSLREGTPAEVLLTGIAVMAVFLADIYAVSWVGMWHGLSAKDLKKASGETVSRVLVWPWLVLMLIQAILALLRWWMDWELDVPYLVNLMLWAGLSLGADYLFMTDAKGRLRNEFRTIAMQRYLPEKPHGFWTVLGRWYGKLTKT